MILMGLVYKELKEEFKSLYVCRNLCHISLELTWIQVVPIAED